MLKTSMLLLLLPIAGCASAVVNDYAVVEQNVEFIEVPLSELSRPSAPASSRQGLTKSRSENQVKAQSLLDQQHQMNEQKELELVRFYDAIDENGVAPMPFGTGPFGPWDGRAAAIAPIH